MSKTEAATNGLTADEFESELADLIRTANRNNVETTRSLDVTSLGPEGSEWMVEITRLDRSR